MNIFFFLYIVVRSVFRKYPQLLNGGQGGEEAKFKDT